MNKRKAIFLIVPFLSIIFSVGLLNFFIEDKDVSKSENRELQQMPGIGAIKDKTFTSLFETYYTDQFMFRDELIKADIKWQMFTKKSNIKGLYLADDNWIMGGVETSEKKKDEYKPLVEKVEKINKMVEASNKKMYYVSLPHKVKTLYNKYPKKYINKNYGFENHEKFLSMLKNDDINTIDIGKYFVDNFSEKTLEKFYFKTDHHWNSLGAYEAFKYIIEDLNKTIGLDVDLSKYTYKTSYIKNKPFLGSYNNNLYGMFTKDEDVPYVYMDRKYNNKYYELKDGKFEEVEEDYIIGNGIDDDEISYEKAYTGNHSYYKIVNKNANTKEKVLMIRDSYQAPLTWLFSDIFEEVEVVDLRATDLNIDDILKMSDSNIVMLMFNNGFDVDAILTNRIE